MPTSRWRIEYNSAVILPLVRIAQWLPTILLLGSLHAQPANPQKEPPKAESSISGQVVNAATGEPLKKAVVSLNRQDSQQYRARQKDVDAAGRFVFDNLEGGRYSLSASRSGFTTQIYGAKRPGSRTSAALTLLPKQEMKDLKISLTPHGVVLGRVVDEDGDPRVGIQVSAMKSEWQGSKRQMASYGFASTNDLGEYRMFGIPPGSYVIQAAPQREMGQTMPEPNFNLKPEDDYVNTYYPGTMDSTTAAPVQVKSGVELRGIDIKMVKARVVRVRGNVTGIGSRPPMGAFLLMMPKDRGWGGGLDMRQAMVTDAKGSFEFRGVTAGQYTLLARSSSPDGQLSCSQTVNVADQPVVGLQMVLKLGGSISGSVTSEGEESAPGKPDPGAMPLSVYLVPAEPGNAGLGGESAEVRDNGTFTVKSIQPGRYRVTIFGGGAGYLKSARVGAEDAMEGLEVPEGGVSGTLEIVMSRRGAEVGGTLLDAKDKPLPGAIAVLLPEDKYREQLEHFGIGTADQFGTFSIKNVRPGKYKLIAIEGDEGTEWMDPEFVRSYESKAIALTLEDGQKETRQLTVRPRAEVDSEKQ